MGHASAIIRTPFHVGLQIIMLIKINSRDPQVIDTFVFVFFFLQKGLHSLVLAIALSNF